MKRNIELKTKYANHTSARNKLRALGAKEQTPMVQVDTYFCVATGRLKLREMADRAELIWYQRADVKRTRDSRYTLVKVADPAALKLALAGALGVRGIVKKRREWFLWKNVRIHLDTVRGLGKFIEFEAVIGPSQSAAAGHERVERLCEALGISKRDHLSASYSDLAGI